MKLEAQPPHRFSNSVCAKIVESLYRLPWTIATTKTEGARGGKGFDQFVVAAPNFADWLDDQVLDEIENRAQGRA